MNTRWIRAAAGLIVLATATACEPPPIDAVPGEIGIVYQVEGATRTDRDAKFDFGSVFAAQSVTQKVVIRNMGRGSITLTSLEAVEGTLEGAWTVNFEPGTVLAAAEIMELDVTFAPPETPEVVDYVVKLQLTAENTRPGEETAIITLTGRGVPGACELPTTLDFGNVAVDDLATESFEVKNPTLLPAEANVGEIYSSSGDHNAFAFAAESPRGAVTLDADTTQPISIDFRPTEAKSYFAFIKARASAQCPEQTISLTGNGVDAVLTWEPALVNCGYVTPGLEVTEEVTFSNKSAAEITVKDLDFGVYKNEFRYLLDGGATAFLVPAATRQADGKWTDGTFTLPVVCAPKILGQRNGQLKFETSAAKQPNGAITVRVYGGGPDIDVQPNPILNLGKVAYFPGANPPSYTKKKVTIMNVGTSPGNGDVEANLHLDVSKLTIEPPGSEFTLELVDYPQDGLPATAPANLVNVMVTFTPTSVGMKQAELVIPSNDVDEPEVRITLAANAVDVPPCNYSVSPTQLAFGLVQAPSYRDLAFTITNHGANPGEICLLSNLDITQPTAQEFSLPGGPIGELEMAPGEKLDVIVRVHPQGATPPNVTNITGRVDFYMSSPNKPQSTVTLTAQLAPACLTIAPADLDYGTVKVGCASATKTFNVYNACGQPVTLHDFSMQAAAGFPANSPSCPGTQPCPEFTIVQEPAIPPGGSITLAPNDPPLVFQAKYKPLDIGTDNGAVAITATQGGNLVTYLVTLRGKGDTTGQHTDVYLQDAKPKADILLVIDNSGSMGPYQQSLAANFGSFIKYAVSAQVDYHIAVVHTDPTMGDFGKFIFNNAPNDLTKHHPEKILTPTTPDVENRFKAKVNVGAIGGTEYEAEAAYRALTAPLINTDNAGFLRNEAALAIVAVTDEPDQSPQNTAFYLNAFWNLKGHNRKTMFTFNAIAGFGSCQSDSGELAFYVNQTDGVMDAICTPDWSKTLEALGKSAFGFRTNFYLTSQPDLIQGPVEVRIDGMIIDPVDERGATVWTYDSVGNSVNFEPMYVPEPGQTLTITFHTTCYQ